MKVTKKLSALLAFGLAANMAYADVDIYLSNPSSSSVVDGKVVYYFNTNTVLNSVMCNNVVPALLPLTLELIVMPDTAGWSQAATFDGRKLYPTTNEEVFFQIDVTATDNSYSFPPKNTAYNWTYSPVTRPNLGLSFNNPRVVYQPQNDGDTIFRQGKFTLPKMKVFHVNYTCDRGYTVSTKPIGGGQINVWIGGFDITPPVNKTCRLTSNKDQVVNLPTISTTTLRNNNEVSAGHFHLTLDCERNTSLEAVYVGFADATDKTNTSTTLTLTNDSTAKGVGLKLYADNTGQVIKYNPNVESEVSLNKNDAYRLELDRSSGIANASYSVSYVKTSENLTSGSVKGITTFNFYYQ